jgi:hypothetical protein
VEPILAQSIRLGHFLVDRVRVHGFGDGLMECGVKECNALDVRQLISAETDDLQRGEVVTLKVMGLAGYVHIYSGGRGGHLCKGDKLTVARGLPMPRDDAVSHH